MARHESSGNSGERTQRFVAALARLTNVIPRLAQSLDTLGSVSSWRAWCVKNGMGRSYATREELWSTEILPSLAVWEKITPSIKSGDLLYFDEAFDSDERLLLEAYLLPTGRFEGLGFSAFGLALIVK